MRILVHDFAGHPFQIQLSRELARRGHTVMHAYFADIPGPKGKFSADPDDAETLSIEPLRIEAGFRRYSYFSRLKAHYHYFAALKKKVQEFKPDVLLSGNTPTEVQYRLAVECSRQSVRFIHWIQDFYALALETLLSRRGFLVGKLGSAPFHMLERRIFRKSDAVVYISEDFVDYAQTAKYFAKQAAVIENWANLDELPQREKNNSWSRKHGLADKFVFLYSGTMGLKHDPQSLAALAHRFSNRPDVRIVLVSEGIGRQWLEDCKKRENLQNLLLLDFQPFSELPDVLGTADVLLANVEAESSRFSVPSKVLSYLCAGRPILLSIPRANLAARVVQRAAAGYACEPGDSAAFLSHAESLWQERHLAREMGSNARNYAESTFEIRNIGGIFEAVLQGESAPVPYVGAELAADASRAV